MKHIFTTLFIFALLTSTFPLQSHAAAVQLPKTGQATCYNESGAIIDCSGTGQDGELQSGVTWPNPRFTNNGDQSVTDNLTGLIWTKDADLMKTRDPSFDTDGTPQDGVVTRQHALNYIKKLNSENYQGHNDWRLPNRNELESLVNKGQTNPATWLNTQGFSNVQPDYYCSSSTNVSWTDEAWFVHMRDGYTSGWNKSYGVFHVWPVRSGLGALSLAKTGQVDCYATLGDIINCQGTGQDGELQTGVAWPSPRFSDNGDQTVTDNLTGLIWTKEANTATGKKTWQEALTYIKALNSSYYLGHNDWRLSNRNEFESLVNKGQASPATWLNTVGFTNAQSSWYWTSTTIANDTSYAWGVSMVESWVGDYGRFIDKTVNYYVWPVRSGQSVPINSLTFSVVKSGTGTGTVTSSTGGINCGSTCSASITTGTSVTLTATPSSGSTFTGWAGACSGTGVCTVNMDAAKSVTATFTLTVIDGVCGSSNAQSFALAPTSNLCSSGTASTVTNSGTGPWNWLCNSTSSGNSVYCSANNQQASSGMKCGDCDNNGIVSISEVQKSINNFLGL